MFDLDGVLADFYAGYNKIEHDLGREPTVTKTWDTWWNKDVWKHIRSSPTFWESLTSRVTAVTKDRIRYLTSGADVYYVTARPGVNVALQTRAWLNREITFGGNVVLSSRKAEFAQAVNADFAIDDKAGNAVAIAYMAPKTRSFLLDTPYNQFPHDVLGRRVERVPTVNEYLDAVEAAL